MLPYLSSIFNVCMQVCVRMSVCQSDWPLLSCALPAVGIPLPLTPPTLLHQITRNQKMHTSFPLKKITFIKSNAFNLLCLFLLSSTN